jgi:hypothetical protein
MYQHNINSFNEVITTFQYWYSKHNKYAKPLLQNMGIDVDKVKDIKIREVEFSKQGGRIMFDFHDGSFKRLINRQNLQVKLVSNKSGFNQIDKRWVETYQELWNISDDVVRILKHFTGELPPYIDNPKDVRRMFIDELSNPDKTALLDFLKNNQTLIISDILKGRGKFSAEWVLVIIKDETPIKWALKPINVVCNYYGNGKIKISPRGSISIGRITMQRKGGDNGRPSANMLQFKIDPTKLLEI